MDIINVTKIKHFNYLRLKWIASSVPKNRNVFCWDVASNLDSRLICPVSHQAKVSIIKNECASSSPFPVLCAHIGASTCFFFGRQCAHSHSSVAWLNITPRIKNCHLYKDQETARPKPCPSFSHLCSGPSRSWPASPRIHNCAAWHTFIHNWNSF